LRALTVYTVRVRGGATDPRVKDAAGNALAADATWSFTTVADTTPPTVTAIVPASGATGVAATTTVRTTFSEDMDPATINTNTVQLTAPGGALVPATVTYAAATRVATLTPSSTLAAFTVYTATVRGGATDPRVKDQAGNALATTRTWNFRTQ
jgi:Bacterial Ig-like domain